MQMDGDESSNIEDRRGDGGYFGGGGGGYGGMGGIPIPTGGGGGLFKGGLGFVAFIVIALIFGADPFALLGGGDTSSYAPAPTQTSRTAMAAALIRAPCQSSVPGAPGSPASRMAPS